MADKKPEQTADAEDLTALNARIADEATKAQTDQAAPSTPPKD